MRRSLAIMALAGLSACMEPATASNGPSPRLTVMNTGGGTVVVHIDGDSGAQDLLCGTDCDAELEYGAQITLTPQPGTSSTFLGWGGNCTGEGSCTMVVTELMHVAVAAFGPVRAYGHVSVGDGAAGGDELVTSVDLDISGQLIYGARVRRGAETAVVGAAGSSIETWEQSFLGAVEVVDVVHAGESVIVLLSFWTSVSLGDGTVLIEDDGQGERSQGALLEFGKDGSYLRVLLRLSGSDQLYPRDLALRDNGNFVVGVEYAGSLEAPSGAIISEGSRDTGVLEVDAEGVILGTWSAGSTAADRLISVAAGPDGALWTLAELGPSAGLERGLVLSRIEQFTTVWQNQLNASGSPSETGVLTGALQSLPDGDVLVASSYAGELHLGEAIFNSPLLDGAVSQAGFVARVSPSGNTIWSTGVGSDRFTELTDACVSGSAVVVVGTYAGLLSLGEEAGIAHGNGDIIVAGLDLGSGLPRWSRRLGGPVQDTSSAIACSGGSAVLGGVSGGQLHYGSGEVTAEDGFVLRVAFE